MSSGPAPGLRERKIAKTKSAIQQNALRLFMAQGYYETTIDQIAEAVEISPSTIFRYFPTKEDLVLQDDYDPIVIRIFREQPKDLSLVQALRATMSQVISAISAEEMAELRQRLDFVLSVDELRARLIDSMRGSSKLMTSLASERTGLPADDATIRTLVSVTIGIWIGVLFEAIEKPDSDYFALIDQSFGILEDSWNVEKTKVNPGGTRD